MIDWSRVDEVLLDMDGTLLDLRFDNRFWLEHLPRRYAVERGMAPEEALEELRERMRAVEGTIRWYSLDYWSDELGFDVLSLHHEWREDVAFRPGAVAFLQAVGRSRRRRLLVTNAHPDVLRMKLEQTGLAEYVDAIVSSHDYGHSKEDARFWNAFRADRSFDAARALLVDDNHSVLRAARRWGIGQTVGIATPDTDRPPRASGEFALIAAFADVHP